MKIKHYILKLITVLVVMSRTMLDNITRDNYTYVMNQLNADWKAIPYLKIVKNDVKLK